MKSAPTLAWRTCTILVMGVALVASPTSAQTDPSAVRVSAVQGRVVGTFEGERRSLPHAVVEATAPGFSRTAVADSLGRYALSGLPPGQVRVRASHAAYESITLTVLLPPSGTVRVDLELRAEPVRLPALDVVGTPERETAIPEAGGATIPDPALELQALELAPGVGQPGLLEAVRALPGNDPASATDVLFMRGSTTDLKLVLLDGVPVYTPFHVAGLLRSFEPSVLGRADLHVGGAPARYDGGLTHILDLGTRKARRDRVAGSGAIDLLSASLAAETPLGARAGAIVSARSLHDLGRAPLGGERPYGYRDLLVSVDAEPSEGHAVRATGFWNDESVRLDFGLGSDDAEWSNAAGSLSYRAPIGSTVLELTAGASAYRASLPLQPSGDSINPLPPPILAAAAVDRVRMVAETRWGSPAEPTRAGISVDRIETAYDASGGGTSSRGGATSTTPGAFVDLTRTVADGATLRVGLRADAFEGGGIRAAPRAALHLEIGPEALLTLAAGRYHQATRDPDFEVERTLLEVAEDDIPDSELLPVATADHVVLSLDQRLGGSVGLGLEGFWKRFEGLSTSSSESVRSSGIDVRLVGSGERGVAWLGYGLSWFWSTIDFSGHASDFAGRHLLTAGASGALLGRLRGELRFAYGAGLPYSAIPFGSTSDALSPGPEDGGPRLSSTDQGPPPLAAGLDEEFLRVDVELHARWEVESGGRTWSIKPYLRILNALDRRDALFYTFQPWRPDDVRPLAERPFLPLFGVAFTF